MKKYKVHVPYAVFVTIPIEVTEEELQAEGIKDEEDIQEYAINKALHFITIQNFSGNGGVDKLIGVTGQNASIDCCDDPLDGEDYSFVIEVEKVDEN